MKPKYFCEIYFNKFLDTNVGIIDESGSKKELKISQNMNLNAP